MNLVAVVWHFWIAVPIVAAALVLLVLTIAGYLRKVVSPRYPGKQS